MTSNNWKFQGLSNNTSEYIIHIRFFQRNTKKLPHNRLGEHLSTFSLIKTMSPFKLNKKNCV